MSVKTLTPSYGKALRVWWAFTWRWSVWVGVGCVALGIPIGVYRTLFGLSPETILDITSWATIPILIAAQIEAMRRTLDLGFVGFEVRLLEKARPS